MTDEQSLQELQSCIKQVIEADTDDFFELAKILGRNPLEDLAGANLSSADLSNTDFSGADLSNTNLTGANLCNTNLTGANLSDADLSSANLFLSNLSDANLSRVKVENARFGKNSGLSEEMKLNLKQRGAVFIEQNQGEAVFFHQKQLLIVKDDKRHKEFTLQGAVYSIGRGPKCDIRLFSIFVPRRQATLVRRQREDGSSYYRIIDCADGLLINGRKLQAHDLQDGDEVMFGPEVSAKYYLSRQETDVTRPPDELDKAVISSSSPSLIGELEN